MRRAIHLEAFATILLTVASAFLLTADSAPRLRGPTCSPATLVSTIRRERPAAAAEGCEGLVCCQQCLLQLATGDDEFKDCCPSPMQVCLVLADVLIYHPLCPRLDANLKGELLPDTDPRRRCEALRRVVWDCTSCCEDGGSCAGCIPGQRSEVDVDYTQLCDACGQTVQACKCA